MNPRYDTELKKELVRIHIEEGRSLNSISEEYNISKASISNWCRQFREEYKTNEKPTINEKTKTKTNGEIKINYGYVKDNIQLQTELAKLQKENAGLQTELAKLQKENAELQNDNDFLKKAVIFFAKSN